MPPPNPNNSRNPNAGGAPVAQGGARSANPAPTPAAAPALVGTAAGQAAPSAAGTFVPGGPDDPTTFARGSLYENHGSGAGDALAHTDMRDFMYGRDPNYATNTAAAERAASGANAASLNAQGANANAMGARAGQQMGAYGAGVAAQAQGTANTSQEMAANLGLMGNTLQQQGVAMSGREGAQVDYGQSLGQLSTASGRADTLAHLEDTQGPSAAQAQLQSGLNQSEASNLAMARSGRGWGGSASAMGHAIDANAAAGQQAANSSAALSAQEDAAWRGRQASNLAAASGINTTAGQMYGQQALSQGQLDQQTTQQNDAMRLGLTQQGVDAYGNAIQANTTAGGLGLQGGALGLQGLQQGTAATQAGQALGMQGTQAAQGAYAQGEQMAGINMQAQSQGDQARENAVMQDYGIRQGVAVNNANQTNALWGTGISTAASLIGSGAMMMSDIRGKDQIQPLDASTAGQVRAMDNAGRSAAAGHDAMAGMPSAAENAGRTAAAGADTAQAAKDDARKAQALDSALGALKNVGAGLSAGSNPQAYQQFSGMGAAHGGGYGMQAAPGWGQMDPTAITSDEDEKSGVHRSDALDMVDQAPGYAYRYKDPERHGQGEHYGPMAQDLLKTPAGASAVEKQPDGTLAVNTGRLALAEHAALHSMHRETQDGFAQLRGEIEALKNRKAG